MTVEDYTPTKGDVVKIRMNGERFWLIITHITRSKIYTVVDSYVINQSFSRGDVLLIDESDIIEVESIASDEDIRAVIGLYRENGYTITDVRGKPFKGSKWEYIKRVK